MAFGSSRSFGFTIRFEFTLECNVKHVPERFTKIVKLMENCLLSRINDAGLI